MTAKFADRNVYVMLGDELVLMTEREFLEDHAHDNRRVFRFDVNSFLVDWDWSAAYAEYQQAEHDARRDRAALRNMGRAP